MAQNRVYDVEYKIQAVKLAKEIGGSKAAIELGIPKGTIYAWTKAAREGRINPGPGFRELGDTITLAEEAQMLRKQVKRLEKENRRLKEENEFLEEASAFFAASRQKYRKN